MNHALTSASPAASATHVGSGLNPRLTGGSSRFGKIINTLVQWQSRSIQRHHLRHIEDRLLADMGITRADAEHESRKPFWKG